MKLVVLNDVDYKIPKKYRAHYMTLHTHCIFLKTEFIDTKCSITLSIIYRFYQLMYHLKALFLLYLNS